MKKPMISVCTFFCVLFSILYPTSLIAQELQVVANTPGLIPFSSPDSDYEQFKAFYIKKRDSKSDYTQRVLLFKKKATEGSLFFGFGLLAAGLGTASAFSGDYFYQLYLNSQSTEDAVRNRQLVLTSDFFSVSLPISAVILTGFGVYSFVEAPSLYQLKKSNLIGEQLAKNLFCR